jgi:hypothetical protein
MARTHRADDRETGPCRYCSQHQTAWYQDMRGVGHWTPLPWIQLRWALRWARAAGLDGQITVVETPCPQCIAATRRAS